MLEQKVRKNDDRSSDLHCRLTAPRAVHALPEWPPFPREGSLVLFLDQCTCMNKAYLLRFGWTQKASATSTSRAVMCHPFSQFLHFSGWVHSSEQTMWYVPLVVWTACFWRQSYMHRSVWSTSFLKSQCACSAFPVILVSEQPSSIIQCQWKISFCHLCQNSGDTLHQENKRCPLYTSIGDKRTSHLRVLIFQFFSIQTTFLFRYVRFEM